MKKIEAIIRNKVFEKVREALAAIGVKFFTLMEVKGYGLQKGETIVYRGHSFDSDYIGRLRLDIFATDDKVDEIVNVIIDSAGTGQVGDGKIAVIDVDKLYRIRNKEEGEDAL